MLLTKAAWLSLVHRGVAQIMCDDNRAAVQHPIRGRWLSCFRAGVDAETDYVVWQITGVDAAF